MAAVIARSPSVVSLRRAGPDDAITLKTLIEGGYRGASARRGWTHEADLVAAERISPGELDTLLQDPTVHLLIAERGDATIDCPSGSPIGCPAGCVAITDHGPFIGEEEAGLAQHRASIGLLCVDPALQSEGLGNRLLGAGEDCARRLGAAIVGMTVIDNRAPLLGWYKRRGYSDTGERQPFPKADADHDADDPPLRFAVLVKQL